MSFPAVTKYRASQLFAVEGTRIRTQAKVNKNMGAFVSGYGQ
jgi:hypothetical protein